MKLSLCIARGISKAFGLAVLASLPLVLAPSIQAGAVLNPNGVYVTAGGSIGSVNLDVGLVEGAGAESLPVFGQLTGVKVFGATTNSARNAGEGSAWIEWSGDARGSLINFDRIQHSVSLGSFSVDAQENFHFTAYEVEIYLNDTLSGPFYIPLEAGTREFSSTAGLGTTWNPPFDMEMESWRVRTTLYFAGAEEGDFFNFVIPQNSVDVNVPYSSGAVPEPSTWAMLLTGVGTLLLARRR